VLLYGGAMDSGNGGGHPPAKDLLADTWAWDGHGWIALQPQHTPPALFGARLVDDPTTGKLSLLSGAGAPDASGYLMQEGEWGWTGRDWTRVGDNPLQMSFAAVGADPIHHQLVITGFDSAYPSYCPQSGCSPLPAYDDPGTYVTSGSGWTSVRNGPEWANAGTAYDTSTGQLITASGTQQATSQATFGWNGTSWQTIIAAPTDGVDPQLPWGPCEAAYDDKVGTLVMVCTAPPPANQGFQTWMFTGPGWRLLPSANTPTTSWLGSLAYDPTLHLLFLFAPGSGGSEGVWSFDGSAWAAVHPQT